MWVSVYILFRIFLWLNKLVFNNLFPYIHQSFTISIRILVVFLCLTDIAYFPVSALLIRYFVPFACFI